MLQMIVK